MSAKPGQDWKWQIVDKLDEFTSSVDPGREASTNLLLENEGQENLSWDALKQLFPTCRVQRGDELTALELGRLFGHWSSIWRMLISSQSYLENLTEVHAQTIDLRNKVDAVLEQHLPDAMKGIETGIFHLLADMNNPESIKLARERAHEFETLCSSILKFANLQEFSERGSFLKGLGEATASFPLDADGQPNKLDKLSILIALIRPYAVRAGLPARGMQDAIDGLNGSRITGHHEAFAKRLQRKNAALRPKGRPSKKAPTKAQTTRKKSDNL